MLVNLYNLPEYNDPESVRICRVLPPDCSSLLAWVEKHFGIGWKSECAVSLSCQPCHCFAAQRNGSFIGFACYDATARGYFGPIGVAEEYRHSGIGKNLLIRCLHAMKEDGYGYAVIGWCDDAAPFYSRTVGAVPIPDSAPEQTLYHRMVRFSDEQKPADNR